MKSTVKSTTVDDNEILSDDQTRVLRFTGYQSPFVHDILSCLSSPIGFESAYLKKNPYLRWYGSPPPSSEPNVSFEAKNIPTVETTPTLFFPDLSCLPHHTPTSEPARPLRVRVAPRLDNLFKNNDTPTNLGGGGSRANDCGLAPSAGHGHAFWTPGFSPQANHLAPPRFRCHLRLHQSAYLPGQTVLIRGLWMEASACGPLPAPLSAICPALVATLSLADPTTASRANANAEGISPRPAPPLPLVCALVRVPASIPGGGSDGGMAGKVYANAGGSFLGLALQLPAAAPAGLYTLRIDFLPQTGPSPHSLLPFAEPPLLLPAQCPLRISSPGPPPRFALRLQLDRELADYRLGDPVHVSVLVAPAGDTTATPAQRADPLSLTAAPALPTARSAGGGKPTAMRTKHEKALAFEGDVTLSVTLDDGDGQSVRLRKGRVVELSLSRSLLSFLVFLVSWFLSVSLLYLYSIYICRIAAVQSALAALWHKSPGARQSKRLHFRPRRLRAGHT